MTIGMSSAATVIGFVYKQNPIRPGLAVIYAADMLCGVSWRICLTRTHTKRRTNTNQFKVLMPISTTIPTWWSQMCAIQTQRSQRRTMVMGMDGAFCVCHAICAHKKYHPARHAEYTLQQMWTTTTPQSYCTIYRECLERWMCEAIYTVVVRCVV